MGWGPGVDPLSLSGLPSPTHRPASRFPPTQHTPPLTPSLPHPSPFTPPPFTPSPLTLTLHPSPPHPSPLTPHPSPFTPHPLIPSPLTLHPSPPAVGEADRRAAEVSQVRRGPCPITQSSSTASQSTRQAHGVGHLQHPLCQGERRRPPYAQRRGSRRHLLRRGVPPH